MVHPLRISSNLSPRIIFAFFSCFILVSFCFVAPGNSYFFGFLSWTVARTFLARVRKKNRERFVLKTEKLPALQIDCPLFRGLAANANLILAITKVVAGGRNVPVGLSSSHRETEGTILGNLSLQNFCFVDAGVNQDIFRLPSLKKKS